MEPNNEAPVGTICGNYQVSYPMPNGVNVSLSGYMVDTDTRETLNAKLDDAMAVMQRQARLAAIPQIKMTIEKLTSDLGQHKKAFEAINAKTSRGEILATQEKTQLENLPVNIRALTDRIEAEKKSLAELEAEVQS